MSRRAQPIRRVTVPESLHMLGTQIIWTALKDYRALERKGIVSEGELVRDFYRPVEGRHERVADYYSNMLQVEALLEFLMNGGPQRIEAIYGCHVGGARLAEVLR